MCVCVSAKLLSVPGGGAQDRAVGAAVLEVLPAWMVAMRVEVGRADVSTQAILMAGTFCYLALQLVQKTGRK